MWCMWFQGGFFFLYILFAMHLWIHVWGFAAGKTLSTADLTKYATTVNDGTMKCIFKQSKGGGRGVCFLYSFLASPFVKTPTIKHNVIRQLPSPPPLPFFLFFFTGSYYVALISSITLFLDLLYLGCCEVFSDNSVCVCVVNSCNVVKNCNK